MKGRSARQQNSRVALTFLLVLAVIFGAAAVLTGRAAVPGREGQIRKVVFAGSIAASGVTLAASVLLLLRQKRAKGAKAMGTEPPRNSRPVGRPGDPAQDDDDITVVLGGDNDRFEIEYEITFIHTDEIIP